MSGFSLYSRGDAVSFFNGRRWTRATVRESRVDGLVIIVGVCEDIRLSWRQQRDLVRPVHVVSDSKLDQRLAGGGRG